MEYTGEHILIGRIGQIFISIAFSASIIAAYSFYKSSIKESLKSEWLSLARGSFYIHGISVLGIITCMFIMIYNHYFEYQYVWQHSSKSLPTRYMISCFWEGQEGSFLLWIFWNILLGLVLIRIAKEWEARVLTIVSLIQAFLSSMLIGIYVGNIKIGSSPFVLVRNLDENIGLPWTQMENYLHLWMVEA